MATAKTKLEKLVDEATKLELTLTGKETEKMLGDMIKAKKQELKDAEENSADNVKGKKIFYYVKVKSFINDSETVEEGLYQTDKAIERLEKSRKDYVETYVGKVPDAKLHKIAEHYRVSIFDKTGEEARPSGEILAELVKEL